jgi:hypothetical protein
LGEGCCGEGCCREGCCGGAAEKAVEKAAAEEAAWEKAAVEKAAVEKAAAEKAGPHDNLWARIREQAFKCARHKVWHKVGTRLGVAWRAKGRFGGFRVGQVGWARRV